MAFLMTKTTDGWVLYDAAGNEVLTITTNKVTVNNMTFTNSFTLPSSINGYTNLMSLLRDFNNRLNTLETCLRGDTQILMADGTTKDLKDVEYGDMVMGWDIDNNCQFPVKSYGAFSTGKSNSWQYHVFDNGNILEISNGHGIYSKTRGHCSMSTNWNLGEIGLGTEGEDVMLAFVDNVHESEFTPRYTMVTENNTYFANGILCASDPSTKMRYYSVGLDFYNQNITEEDLSFFQITAQESDESSKLRVRNREYLKETAPMYARLNISKREIGKRKKELEKDDYKTIKYIEGKLDKDSWNDHTSKSQKRRDVIAEQELIRDNLIAEIAHVKEKHSVVTSEKPSVRWKRLYDLDMEYIRNHRAQ